MLESRTLTCWAAILEMLWTPASCLAGLLVVLSFFFVDLWNVSDLQVAAVTGLTGVPDARRWICSGLLLVV